MTKNLLTYIFLILILASCTDSLENPYINNISEDGEVNLNFYIPGIITRRTRAVDPEYQVEDVQLLIFNGEVGTSAPVQTEHIYLDINKNSAPNKLAVLDDTKIRLTFRLKPELRKQPGLRFYFLANSDVDVTTKTENDLTSDLTSYITKISDDNSILLTMCGKTSLSDILDNTIVPLYRNAAKVSVSNKVPTAGSEGTIFYPYELLGSAEESSLTSGITKSTGAPTDINGYPTYVTVTEPGYYHPTGNEENYDNIGGKCYIITKAKFGETEYFYRLDFTSIPSDEEDGGGEYISLLSNHWYQFVILDITAAGYSTPEEAAKHPENGLKYEIHDHCIESYNMISDGFRELGVSHAIEYNGLATAAEGNESEIFIKFFSKDKSEIPDVTKVRPLLTIEDPSWLEFSDTELVTDQTITGGDGHGSDSNDEGSVYKIKLRYKQVDGSGTLYNKITVKWEGLQREIPVIWVRNFTGAEITSAILTIDYNNTQTVIDDYWGFLSSTDNPANLTYSANNLWGIQPEANNGKVRNNGLHFPVMYGADETFAKYSYTLIFNKGKYLNRNDYTWVIEVSGDEAITGKVTASAEDNSYPLTITVTRPAKVSNDDYTYGTGTLKVVITSADGTKDTYSFSLYHTGFFHKETSEALANQLYGPADGSNYFYYEVVPVKVDGLNRYILDRNLSAKSAQDYIRDSDGSTVAGNPDAAGGYYMIARQGEKYVDPVIISNIAPPGYRVPKKNAWEAIRLSNSYHTESNGSYYPTYYDTGNPEIGNIYFPKSMLYMNGALMGESRSGYYWTETPSSGTEKDEIGRWLNMFTITGNSTSFINGYVLVNNDRNKAYGASVRCINDQTDEAVEYRTSFNVSGATHVFLYTEENGVRTSTTSWPGHAIGNYATMSPDTYNYNWFNFVYSSTQFNPNNLYVIFNYVDESGIIYTYSRDEAGNTIKTPDKSPSQIQGWKVVGENIPAIKPSADLPFEESITLKPITDATALGDWWLCGVTNETPHVKVYRPQR